MENRSKVKATRPAEIRAVGVNGKFRPLKMEVREHGKVRVIEIPDPREKFIKAWREF